MTFTLLELIIYLLLVFIFSVVVWQVLKKYIYIKHPKFYVKYLNWSDIK